MKPIPPSGISWADLAPFTAKPGQGKPAWLSAPWIQNGFAWATDARVLVRARIDDEPPLEWQAAEAADDAERTQAARDAKERTRASAIKLFHDSIAPTRDWVKAEFPPCGLPPAKTIYCPDCHTHRIADTDPVSLNHGRFVLDANVLRELHKLPIELDLFVSYPSEPVYFKDTKCDFVGILMPMRLPVQQESDLVAEQWGAAA